MKTMHSPNSIRLPKQLFHLAVVVLAVHFLFVFLAGCAPGDPASQAPDDKGGSQPGRALTATTTVAEREEAYVKTAEYVGKVEAARSSELGFELAGTLLAVQVDEGSEVAKGAVLAELDTARLEARRDELQAALEEADASVELAEATFKRTKNLVARKAVSEQALDEARQDQDAGRAAVRRIRAQLESVEVDLSKSKLVSPFAGTVSTRLLDEGTIVAPGQAVLRLLETGTLEIRAGMSKAVVGELEEGANLSVRTADAREIPVVVERILPQRGTRTRTVDVILSGLDRGTGLRDGDLVGVPVETKVETGGFWIPRTALTGSARGLWSCYVAQPVGKGNPAPMRRVERRELEILHQDGERVFVKGGLREGEHVVTSGVHRLVVGQLVIEAAGAMAGAERSGS